MLGTQCNVLFAYELPEGVLNNSVIVSHLWDGFCNKENICTYNPSTERVQFYENGKLKKEGIADEFFNDSALEYLTTNQGVEDGS